MRWLRPEDRMRFLPGKNARRPSFFLLGAPKCGTTSLSRYLGAHPCVFFSDPKEPEYFNVDFAEDFRYALTESDYRACFARARPVHTAIGEGSVWYLHSSVAVERILEFDPRARFLVMIRNPLDMVPSLHSQLLFSGDEDVEDFEAAWRLQEHRRRGRRLPRRCREPKVLQYGDIGRLGSRVHRLFSVVPRERVHVIVFDDLRNRAEVVYRSVLSFLDLPPHSLPEYSVANANKAVASRSVQALLHAGVRIKRSVGFRRSFGWSERLTRLNSAPGERKPLSGELREELREYFREDVELLGGLIDRNLDPWVETG